MHKSQGIKTCSFSKLDVVTLRPIQSLKPFCSLTLAGKLKKKLNFSNLLLYIYGLDHYYAAFFSAECPKMRCRDCLFYERQPAQSNPTVIIGKLDQLIFIIICSKFNQNKCGKRFDIE